MYFLTLLYPVIRCFLLLPYHPYLPYSHKKKKRRPKYYLHNIRVIYETMNLEKSTS